MKRLRAQNSLAKKRSGLIPIDQTSRLQQVPATSELVACEQLPNSKTAGEGEKLTREDDDLSSIARKCQCLADEIHTIGSEVISGLRRGLGRICKLGELLNKAKVQVPHGRWRNWLNKSLPNLPERTARRYMRVSHQRDGHTLEELADDQLRSASTELGLIPLAGKTKTRAGKKRTIPSSRLPNAGALGELCRTLTELNDAIGLLPWPFIKTRVELDALAPCFLAMTALRRSIDAAVGDFTASPESNRQIGQLADLSRVASLQDPPASSPGAGINRTHSKSASTKASDPDGWGKVLAEGA